MSLNFKWVALVFLVALALRLVSLAYFLPKLNPDADPDSYRSLARNLAAGKGFVARGPGQRIVPNVGRTPVYPAFLAAWIKLGGDRLGLFLAAQCVLGALTAVLTMWLAARWLSRGAAVVAGLLLAADPNSVVRCSDLRTETLFTLLLLAGACLLAWRSHQRWVWFGAGVFWSVAALCRPIAVWLWVVALVLALGWRARWTFFALFLAGFLPLLGLWAARNAALTGRWFVATNATDNLLLSWASGVEADKRGVPVEVVQQELIEKVGLVEFFDERAAFRRRIDESVRVSREILLSAPLLVVKQAALGWAKLLLGPGRRGLQNLMREATPLPGWWAPLYSLALAVGVVLSALGVSRLKQSALLPGLLLLYFVALAGGPVSYSRYRVPVTPVLAVLAVAAFPKARKPRKQQSNENLHLYHRN